MDSILSAIEDKHRGEEMIATDLEHANKQIAMTRNLRQAFDFLFQMRGRDLPEGRIEIAGDEVYALSLIYETLVPGVEIILEAHRKYIDVQYVVHGEEVIGWAHTDRLIQTVPYDPEKDVWHGMISRNDLTPVRLSTGQLAVLYPTDAHAPKLAAGMPMQIKKIVVKVAFQNTTGGLE